MAGVDVRISELPAATEGHADDRFETTQIDGATLVSRSITLEQVSDAVAATMPPPTADWDDITGKPATFPATLPARAVGYGSATNTLTGVAADFNWDATNKRLGIGAPTPAYNVHVASGGNDLFTVDSSGIAGTAGAVRALLPFAWQPGGQWWSSITIGTTSGGYLGLYAGTGVPTASTFGAYGTIYLNGASPGIPYYNSDGTTGWDQLVGRTATQTLTNKTFAPASISPGTNTQVLTTVGGVSAWATPAGGGSVTSVSVVSANGLAGTVATASTTPAITLSTTITGLLKGNATAISAAVSGTDYLPTTGGTGITTVGTIGTGTWQGSLIAGQYGGTGVANTGKTITLGGNLTTAGAFASTFTMTNTTAVTFPTTGTLLTNVTSGTQLQTVFTETGAVATGTTVIPFDDTIPQITEGDQYMTLAITPKSTTSRLVIEVVIELNNSTGGTLIAALFQDATANALAVGWTAIPSAGLGTCISFRHIMTSGTTSATTFRVRGGCDAAGTTSINGTAAGVRRFGGVAASSIVIQEVVP